MEKKFVISALLVALAFPSGMALAESASNSQVLREQNRIERQEIRDQRQENRDAAKEIKEQKWQNRCKNIATKIDTRINRYENNGKMLQTVYGKMLARLQRLSERLKAKNIDVSKLDSDLATLKTKIDKLFADQTAFMATLNALKPTICNQTSDDPTNTDQTTTADLKAKSGEARKIAETIRQDRLDIKKFFQSTIIPDIQSIRKQLAEQKTTKTNDDIDNEIEATSDTGASSATSTTTSTTTSTATSSSTSAGETVSQ